MNNNVALVGKILVVDDNEMNCDMLSRRLRRQGHEVEIALDGRQALDMLKNQSFDLVLLDIMMPGMNGYEVLETIKSDPKLSFLPVIMISAIDELSSLVRCIELGAEDYLPKPFNPVLLRARIGASLEKKRLRDRDAAYTERLNRENQRKSDELENARRIQRAMLPTAPPNLPYLEIAAHQETASEVGGDYYDFFPQPDATLLVAIGDATGHGVGSGLMVSMTKAALLATDQTQLPLLLGKINRILTKVDLGTQLNMGLKVLMLAPQSQGGVTAIAAGGGMPPIYVLRANGGINEFVVPGLPLGIIEEATYQPVQFDLRPGDKVVLMSDGLLEIFNADHQFLGIDRLRAGLAQVEHPALSARQTLEAVALIGRDWAKSHPLYDDITLVVLRIK